MSIGSGTVKHCGLSLHDMLRQQSGSRQSIRPSAGWNIIQNSYNIQNSYDIHNSVIYLLLFYLFLSNQLKLVLSIPVLANYHSLSLVHDSGTLSWFLKFFHFADFPFQALNSPLQNCLSSLCSLPSAGRSTWILFLLFLNFMSYCMTPSVEQSYKNLLLLLLLLF